MLESWLVVTLNARCCLNHQRFGYLAGESAHVAIQHQPAEVDSTVHLTGFHLGDISWHPDLEKTDDFTGRSKFSYGLIEDWNEGNI